MKNQKEILKEAIMYAAKMLPVYMFFALYWWGIVVSPMFLPKPLGIFMGVANTVAWICLGYKWVRATSTIIAWIGVLIMLITMLASVIFLPRYSI